MFPSLKSLIKSFKKPQQRFARRCYSQEGEDMILQRVFGQRREGLFVDVGAHHPFRYSNTYLFYKKGWRGINIDATPGSMRGFEKYRPADINLEVAVSQTAGRLCFYLFDDPAYNTFDADAAEKAKLAGAKLLEKVNIAGRPLKDILNEHLTDNEKIDFLSVDVEGFDLEVLKSNDWFRYKPKYVLVECLDLALPRLSEDKTYIYLNSLGYSIFAKTVNTVFFSCADY
jgi:FkbM family methyltransferase